MRQKKILLAILTFCVLFSYSEGNSMAKPSKPCNEKPCQKKEKEEGCGCSSMNKDVQKYDMAGRKRGTQDQ